jgi:DNA-binding response OmpR family regulator
VPAPHLSSTATGSHRSVLLLEEYDALAAAIGSALKKFAPGHATVVARSLADAETLAGKSDPDLFIIDFDPSYPGLTAFLQKMRSAHPGARALVMTAGVSSEIVAERRSFGALQFIEKPYETADFGAAVQALLGPWTAAESTGSRGTLRSLSLADIVALHCSGARSAFIDVKGSDGDSGVVHILNGQIIHAETDEHSGVGALEEMFTWSSPRMRETAKRAPATRTIHGPWARVFLEAWHRAKSAREAPEAKIRPKTGKKIAVIDDTEMLLIFVEDVLSTADPELQITAALTGTDGISEVQRVLPDLVLLDYSLPDLNGDEVCRRLLQNEQTARIPILMMSGHVLEMTASAARFSNIVATIEKPFLSDALVDLVQRTLAAGLRPAAVEPPPADEPVVIMPKLSPEAQAPPIALEPAAEPTPTILPEPVQSRRTHLRTPILSSPVTPTVSSPVVSGGENDVVLGLFLEVMSMQLTPQLRMGTIRARPASLTVSLHFLSPTARNAIPTEIGFQLGPTELDENGRIATMRLIPTARPFQPAQMRNAFEIGGVALVPSESRARVQLTPAGTTPMTMELLAHLEMGGVELSPTFQVAQLLLKWRTSAVRVTLDPKAPEQTGAGFDVSAVKLDGSGRIAELLLNPGLRP